MMKIYFPPNLAARLPDFCIAFDISGSDHGKIFLASVVGKYYNFSLILLSIFALMVEKYSSNNSMKYDSVFGCLKCKGFVLLQFAIN